MSTPTTFWRLAGMSYTQYVTRASSTLRAALKEPARSKALEQEKFSYNAAKWAAGETSGKTPIDTLKKAGTV
eukprot:CAMPEP_0195266904 /NCGR_PEP_ID=MMETSP0706-20130129/12282_1 /TAXON_ID=33640 /ORGANISM="Asterionellopsis glacialis, Strain CCMP134" /LENGTH=71 /DNA_ID=CAMNT_0040321573 /DNA_START=27 /DNA_END=242 /DNA_ORIENTATION=+